MSRINLGWVSYDKSMLNPKSKNLLDDLNWMKLTTYHHHHSLSLFLPLHLQTLMNPLYFHIPSPLSFSLGNLISCAPFFHTYNIVCYFFSWI